MLYKIGLGLIFVGVAQGVRAVRKGLNRTDILNEKGDADQIDPSIG